MEEMWNQECIVVFLLQGVLHCSHFRTKEINLAVSMGKCLGNRLKPVKIICLDLVDLSREAMQITSKS